MTKNTSGKHASVASTSSRRAFLKGLGAAGVSVPLAAIAASAASTGKQIPDVLSGPGVLNLNARPGQAFNKRLSAAADDLRLKVPPQPNNGDEVRYKSGIANYTKGFAHDSFGVVVPAVYESYLAAVQTGKRQDFANLPVGGTEPLVDPQAGHCLRPRGLRSIAKFDSAVCHLDEYQPRRANDRSLLAGADARRPVHGLLHRRDDCRRGLRAEWSIRFRRSANRRQRNAADRVPRVHGQAT